jgi:hypothetical protein
LLHDQASNYQPSAISIVRIAPPAGVPSWRRVGDE